MRATDQGTGNEGPWAETEIASARRASQRRGCWGWVLRSKSEPDEQGGRGIQAGRGGGAEAGAGTCPVCAWLMSVLLHSWGLNHDLRIPQSQGRVSGGVGGCSQLCAAEDRSGAEWRVGWRGRTCRQRGRRCTEPRGGLRQRTREGLVVRMSPRSAQERQPGQWA